MGTIKETKAKIKALKKLKKWSRVGTQQRRDFNRQIRELQEQLDHTYNIDDEKQKLIDEIYRLKPELKALRNFDLRKFSKIELQKHIDLTKKKKGK